MTEMSNAYKILVGKASGKRLLWRPRRRRENYIRMKREGADLTQIAQDRDQWRALMNTVMDLRILQKVGNMLT